MSLITASICLTDIDKSKITKSEKNGKQYLSIVVAENRQPDNYGNTHGIYINQSKEERERGDKKVYIGNGKERKFNNEQQPSSNTYTTPPGSYDPNSEKLPF